MSVGLSDMSTSTGKKKKVEFRNNQKSDNQGRPIFFTKSVPTIRDHFFSANILKGSVTVDFVDDLQHLWEVVAFAPDVYYE